MAYTGFHVFGDSLVDAGNALKLAQWYGSLTFSDLPEGAPTAALGYFAGRFSNGYTFADLLANKTIGVVTTPVFPYGFEDPWIGIPIAPWAGDPSGNNLNFAYGGAQVRQGDEVVQDLDSQTDTFRDAVDGDAPPDALYVVTMGGNDVRNLAKAGSLPAPVERAHDALDQVAQQLIHELGQLIDDGARHFLITGTPDVGLIPKYAGEDGVLDPIELAGSEAATAYSQYLDMLIRTEVVPALKAMGADVTYVPMMDYQAGATTVTGGLTAVLPTLEALHGLAPGTLTTNLLDHASLVFFDDVHPTAQVHALFGSYAHAILTKTPWIETLPLTDANVDYTTGASISVAGEVDSLVISLVAGTTYTIEMLGMSSLGLAGSVGDPALRLLGPGGNLIGADADSGAGFDATLTFTAAASGNHTAQFSATGSLTGAYVFQAAVISGAAMETANTYVVSNALTVVLEGAGGLGDDVVKASVSYTLSPGSEIEVLQTANNKGKGAINLTGNEFGQAIIGNAGGNVLDGKGGADTLTGGAGKDVFVLGTGGIDAITDYGTGDVVDVSQVLSVAGANVPLADYVRVTTGGLVQVDANGGGDSWVTLATINNGGAVTIRYVAGGTATNVSIARVNASSSTAMTGAVAAAGLMAMSTAAGTEGAWQQDHGDFAIIAAAAGNGAEMAEGSVGSDRLALGGELREAVDAAATHRGGSGGPDGSVPSAAEGLFIDLVPVASPMGLPAGTDTPVANGWYVADAIAMPSLPPVPVAVPAVAGGELAAILADALAGGDPALPGIDALLDSVPVLAQSPLAAMGEALAGWADGLSFMTGGLQTPAVDLMQVHADAVIPA